MVTSDGEVRKRGNGDGKNLLKLAVYPAKRLQATPLGCTLKLADGMGQPKRSRTDGGYLHDRPALGVGGEDPWWSAWPELREAGPKFKIGIGLAVEGDAAVLQELLQSLKTSPQCLVVAELQDQRPFVFGAGGEQVFLSFWPKAVLAVLQ